MICLLLQKYLYEIQQNKQKADIYRYQNHSFVAIRFIARPSANQTRAVLNINLYQCLYLQLESPVFLCESNYYTEVALSHFHVCSVACTVKILSVEVDE